MKEHCDSSRDLPGSARLHNLVSVRCLLRRCCFFLARTHGLVVVSGLPARPETGCGLELHVEDLADRVLDKFPEDYGLNHFYVAQASILA